MKNILVTLELDDTEAPILDAVQELAIALDAKVWLLHIAEPDPDFVGYTVGPQYIRDVRASELRNDHKGLQKYVSILKDKGVKADGLMISGPTIEMIMEESKKLDIDLIVTGQHDRSFLYKAFVGSVSSGIIKKSTIPVMMVPI